MNNNKHRTVIPWQFSIKITFMYTLCVTFFRVCVCVFKCVHVRFGWLLLLFGCCYFASTTAATDDTNDDDHMMVTMAMMVMVICV